MVCRFSLAEALSWPFFINLAPVSNQFWRAAAILSHSRCGVLCILLAQFHLPALQGGGDSGDGSLIMGFLFTSLKNLGP